MAATKVNSTQINGTSASSGATDAGKPVVTDTNGQIAVSLLNNAYAIAIIMRS